MTFLSQLGYILVGFLYCAFEPFATNWNNFPMQFLFNYFVLSGYVKGLPALY